jgi:hypothetical protein
MHADSTSQTLVSTNLGSLAPVVLEALDNLFILWLHSYILVFRLSENNLAPPEVRTSAEGELEAGIGGVDDMGDDFAFADSANAASWVSVTMVWNHCSLALLASNRSAIEVLPSLSSAWSVGMTTEECGANESNRFVSIAWTSSCVS